ncbi:PAS domain-containing protein [Profundibacter sp.]
MGFVEKRNVYRPATGEAPFGFDEIFFSRTDHRGVIECGNYVFKRVSDYDWDDLIGAPHKRIRHPDMPKGVFWLFWKTLKAGEPIGAYVKNKARDGLYYWVYAVAMPFQGGFLSIRIKPASDLFETIKQEYEVLRKAEENGLTPEESAAQLVQRIGELGYADYRAFESDALTRELAARDIKVKTKIDPEVEKFTEMADAASALKTETISLSDGFHAVSTVPTNMRIIASRLEPSGGAVSALSQNYWAMSEEMAQWFRRYVTNSDSDFATMCNTLAECRFLLGTARMLREMSTSFSLERRALGGCDLKVEQQQMTNLAVSSSRKAMEGLNKVSEVALRISRAVAVMRRFTLGLSSTRVMCNIESARLSKGGESLNYVITQLAGFQTNVDDQLERIEDLSLSIQRNADALMANGDGPKRRPPVKFENRETTV